MKAIEILENLATCNCLPCGIACHRGDIFAGSVERNEKAFKFMDGNFNPDSLYLEFLVDRVPPILWRALEDYDVAVDYDFGSYRYWEIV